MDESWQDAYVTSVHGRSMKGLAQRIDGKEKVAILTDTTIVSECIAHYLLSFGMTEYNAFVAENLGGDDGKICLVSSLRKWRIRSFLRLML